MANKTPKCSLCHKTILQLCIPWNRIRKGALTSHEHLCQGLDSEGNPLGIPTTCLVLTDCTYSSHNAEQWIKHYKNTHEIVINSTQNLRWLRNKYQQYLLPDFGMNGGWGRYLTKRSPFQASNQISCYSKEAMDPYTFESKYRAVLADYRAAFEKFFTCTPLSFHQHVSDIAPITIASIIHVLETFPGADPPEKRLTVIQKKNPMISGMKGLFGGYYGSLAHGGNGIFPNLISSKCGPPPQLLTLRMTRSVGKLKAKLDNMARSGYIAVIVEIVRQSDGHVLSKDQWEAICEACESAGLYVIVDETISAIRCGAPFAYQLQQYKKYRPSFVYFGKVVATGGVAVCWDGVYINRLDIKGTEIQVTTDLWDQLPSQPWDPFNMLRSWGTIEMATRDRWTKRAVNIGRILREILYEIHPDIELAGLAALIYMPSKFGRKTAIVGAATTKNYLRWMPYLDDGMMDEKQVRLLFGPGSRSLRAALKEGIDSLEGRSLRDQFCIDCAECAGEEEAKLCSTCSGYLCDSCQNNNFVFEEHSSGECLS